MPVLEIIVAAGEIVGAVSALASAAGPALDSVDKEAVAEAMKKAADAASETAGKAKDALGDAAKTVGDVVERASNATNKMLDDAARKKAEKALQKAVKEVRQSILENATTTITAADLAKAKEKPGALGPINSMPGCFVIATYKKFDFDKDLTDYINIYVGKAENASDGVNLAISRDGDPDVYADVKYNQNVHIYVYNCLPEDLEEQYASLVETFAEIGAGE